MRTRARCSSFSLKAGAVFIFVLHNSRSGTGAGARARVRRACVRFAAIEIATRLSDVTCVTEPRPRELRATHPFCVLLENARAGRGGPAPGHPAPLRASPRRPARRASEALVSIYFHRVTTYRH